jgi:phosphatidylinositol-3-phosphatase
MMTLRFDLTLDLPLTWRSEIITYAQVRSTTPFHMKLISHKMKNRKLAFVAACLLSAIGVQAANAQITTVFYILLENRNFTQNEGSYGQQVVGSPAMPYINSLITPGNPNAAQVSYCSCYHNDLAVYNGSGPSIHPSEPNYVWMENGSNESKADDNDPYGSGASVQQIYNYMAANGNAMENLSGLLQTAGVSWKSYSEGVNLLNASGANINTAQGNLTTTMEPSSQWTVPLVSFSGANASYTNPYNGSDQWNFACKHTGQLFFPTTNGSTVNTADAGTTNVDASHYPPLAYLATDLANNTQAAYNVITPDQYNDMHTALSAGFTYHGTHYTGDSAQVAQADNFCSIVVPEIEASPVYQAGHAVIILWTDETEGSNQNDFNHTLTEIAISPLCKGNAYDSTLNCTHSSDLATMQKIFGVTANTPTGFLNDAANASNATPAGVTGTSQEIGATYSVNGGTFTGTAFTQAASPTGGFGTGTAQDLSDLFQSGVIPPALPGLNLTVSGYSYNRHTAAYSQTVTVTNVLAGAISNPIYLVLGGLSSPATLTNSAGTTINNAPGSPYVLVSQTGLAAGASAAVSLQYSATGPSTMSAITTDGQP